MGIVYPATWLDGKAMTPNRFAGYPQKYPQIAVLLPKCDQTCVLGKFALHTRRAATPAQAFGVVTNFFYQVRLES